MIKYASEQFRLSKQTIRTYLCQFLSFQNISVLAPKEKKERELNSDEKTMRWALNKYFYTRNKNSLKIAYEMMLKAKYCDEFGKLIENYPTFNQFRYFYRKTRKEEKYLISRNGLKDYQKNNRPLLGDGVQQYAPYIGTAMLDSTICDIYLVNESGELVGRPVLSVACDANTSLCLGYTLGWEGNTYSLGLNYTVPDSTVSKTALYQLYILVRSCRSSHKANYEYLTYYIIEYIIYNYIHI